MIWITLLYLLPMVAVLGATLVAVFSPRFSKLTGLDTVEDAVMIAAIGLIPIANLWLVLYSLYFLYVKDWWNEAKGQYLHRLLHD